MEVTITISTLVVISSKNRTYLTKFVLKYVGHGRLTITHLLAYNDNKFQNLPSSRYVRRYLIQWARCVSVNNTYCFYVGPRIPDMYQGPRNERGNPTTLYYTSNNSAMFLARENNKTRTYLQLMSFIQMTKTTNIYIYMKTRSSWCYIIHYYITLSF